MNILFLCTHNACRSILAEAIFRAEAIKAGVNIRVQSAGSTPRGTIHPLTLQYLKHWQIDTAGLTSKSWDEMADFVSDLVITVCDQAAGESCPVWFGKAVKAHWSLPDPSRYGLSPDVQKQEFSALYLALQQRAKALFQATTKPDSTLLSVIATRFPLQLTGFEPSN